MLIKRVYEADPLACPKCGGTTKVIAFIEPPQREVIERILRHCEHWKPSTPRPPPGKSSAHDRNCCCDGDNGCSDEPQELTYVDEDTSWATF